MILSCNCWCLIDLPTRRTETSKTLIDHVITNDKQRAVTTGVLISDLSDHYGILRRQLKQAKLDYYHHLLNENKGNAKKTWAVINELTNIKHCSNVQPSKLTLNNYDTVSKPQIIAEKFNSFFVNIGKEMAASILILFE